MNHDELKTRVMAEIETTWPRFQQEHPALAQVIDQTMLSEHVVESLAKNEEFQQAYQRAVEAKVGAQALPAVVARFIEAVLQRLR
jgi:hypothetical protein